MSHANFSDGGGSGRVSSSSARASVNRSNMKTVGGSMTSGGLESVDLRSTITANGNARMAFVAGESGFASLGTAFVSAGDAIGSVSRGWERTDHVGESVMKNIMGPTV